MEHFGNEDGNDEEENKQRVREGGARRFNFGKLVEEDEWVFGMAGPAKVSAPRKGGVTGDAQQVGRASSKDVEEWLDFATREQSIKRFVMLLSEAELSRCEANLLQRIATQEGVTAVCNVVSLSERNAFQRVATALRDAVQAKEQVAVVCASGQVRTATVGAMWAFHWHFCPPAIAVDRVHEFAKTQRCIRRPSKADLANLISLGENGKTSGSHLPLDLGSTTLAQTPRLDQAWGTPRSVALQSARLQSARTSASLSQPCDVLFVTTGGTIDKDYPRATGGYAFELGTPAIQRMLSHLHEIHAVAFSHRVVSVCRKDSQEITLADREAMVAEILRNSVNRVVVTHGTDTMIETASFLHDALAERTSTSMVVALTGACRPHAFAHSDAMWNVGAALGTVNNFKLENGVHVFICMGGMVARSDSVIRDPATGLFQSSAAPTSQA